MQATCTRPSGDRGAGVARDTRYRRPVAAARSSAQAPLVIVVRRASSSRTSERWRHHNRHGEEGAGRNWSRGRRRAASGQDRPQTADNPRAAPSCDAVRRAKKGRLDEGRHPRERCLPKFRRTPRKRRPGRKTGVRKTAASGQPPHESKDYSKSGPPPFPCAQNGTTRPRTLQMLCSILWAIVADAPGPSRPTTRRPTTHKRRPRAWQVVALVIAVVALAWVGVRGLLARGHLERARAGVEQLRADLLAAHGVNPMQLPTIQDDTRRARALTDDPIWRTLAHTPYAGRTLRTTSGLAAAVDDVAQRALPDIVDAGDALAPSRLRTGGAAINLAPLQAAQPALTDAAARLTAVTTSVKALPTDGVLPPVRRASDQLTGQLTSLTSQVDDAALAAKLLPPMLGAAGPRRYLVIIQDNAEARGTGGLLGAYATLEADDGQLRLTSLESNSVLQRLLVSPQDAGLPAEYVDLYSD